MVYCRGCGSTATAERVEGSTCGGVAGQYYRRCPNCGYLKVTVIVAREPRVEPRVEPREKDD